MLRPTLGTGSVLQEMGWQHRDGTSSHCRWGRSAQPSGEGTEPESLCPKRERWDEEEEEEEAGICWSFFSTDFTAALGGVGLRGGSDRALLSSQSVALAMMEKKRHSSSSSTLGVGWLLDHGMETKPIMGNADPQEQPWDWTVRRAEKGSLPPAEEGLGGSRGALPPTAPPSPTPTPAGLSSSRPSSSDANEFHQRDSGQAMSRGWCEPSPRSC